MNYFFLFAATEAKRKVGPFLVLLLFISYEAFLPLSSWAQSFSDTGSFTFTGGQNPVRIARNYRKFLPGEGVKVGPMQVHPFLGVAEVWTDNVFRTKNRDEDFLTTIAPGFQALLPFGGNHSFLLDYRAAQFLYSKFSGNNALTQNGVGHLALDFPGGLKIDVDANIVGGFDARGSEVDSQQPDITKWNSSTFRSTAQLIGASFGVRGGVRFTQLNFRNNGQDRRRDRGNAAANFTIFIPASVTTSGLLGAFVSDENYSKNNQLDSLTYGVFTGFRLAPSRQLSGELNLGYNILTFDRAPEGGESDRGRALLSQGLNLGGRQQKAIFLSGNLRWRPTTRLDIVLTPSRSIQQSAVLNTSTFTQTAVAFRVQQRVQDRLFLSGSLLYANSEFEEGRNDDRFRFRTELDYRTVKWLGFRLAYIFEKRLSNQSNFEFYGNTIMFSVQGYL